MAQHQSDDSATELRDVVAASLGTAVKSVPESQREPLDYDAFLAHRTVSRLRGTAETPDGPMPWSLIEKVTEGPAIASAYLYDNGLREFRAYESALLDDLAPGVAAARTLGLRAADDGRLTLWLEDLAGDGRRLTAADIAVVARHLGRLAGRWLGRVPEAPWLFTGWIDRHGQLQAIAPARDRLRALTRRPAIEARLRRSIDAVEALLDAQPRIGSVLAALPMTLCHHDAVGANVFVRTSGDTVQTVLIDWEMVGPGPVGADLASLVFSSARRGDLSATAAIDSLPDALAAYRAGLDDMGASVDAVVVRRGFDASIALRWALARDVIVALEDGTSVRRGSRPGESPEEAMAELLTLTSLLFEAAEATVAPSPAS